MGTYPTPLEPAPRLAAALGLDQLWIKRDDLIGLGGGGNKVRKLEYTLAAARAHRADLVVTSGAAQSNHARLTAAGAARLGLRAVLVLEGHEPPAVTGNLLLNRLFGAEIIWAGEVRPAELGTRVAAEAERRRAGGERVEVIPFGGSSVLGARGYEEAGAELLRQIPDLDTVVVALGSGGTMAGLVNALGADRVLGVDVGAVDDPGAAVLGLVRGSPSLRIRRATSEYGRLTTEVRQALQLVARTEGVVLDPVYTGRAAAGLIAAVEDGSIRPDERTVLLHTGGLPGLFGHPENSGIYA
ncbi:D-cysteine desulfhydrase family protein [Kineosporia mesophila]|uniref:D-cysteine desulfhydrase family protein n=2 Tax=Kineosporia mesophila TaxID=566012 RepID=A0ABP6Z0M6_9ACTN